MWLVVKLDPTPRGGIARSAGYIPWGCGPICEVLTSEDVSEMVLQELRRLPRYRLRYLPAFMQADGIEVMAATSHTASLCIEDEAQESFRCS